MRFLLFAVVLSVSACTGAPQPLSVDDDGYATFALDSGTTWVGEPTLHFTTREVQRQAMEVLRVTRLDGTEVLDPPMRTGSSIGSPYTLSIELPQGWFRLWLPKGHFQIMPQRIFEEDDDGAWADYLVGESGLRLQAVRTSLSSQGGRYVDFQFSEPIVDSGRSFGDFARLFAKGVELECEPASSEARLTLHCPEQPDAVAIRSSAEIVSLAGTSLEFPLDEPVALGEADYSEPETPTEYTKWLLPTPISME